MMTTNLIVIANVKQLQTGGSFRILLPFFWTSLCVGILNSAIFNNVHNRVEFGTILEGVQNLEGGGGLNTPTPPQYTTDMWKHLTVTVIPISVLQFHNPCDCLYLIW